MEITAVDVDFVAQKQPLPWYNTKPVDHAKQCHRQLQTPANSNPIHSLTATDLVEIKVEQRAENELQEDAKLQKKTERDLAFRLCGVRCQCGQTPCPVEGLKMCR
eukprot:SAG11_NODE_7701_length_1108_cov_1.124876_3_plen_104_part_01